MCGGFRKTPSVHESLLKHFLAWIYVNFVSLTLRIEKKPLILKQWVCVYDFSIKIMLSFERE